MRVVVAPDKFRGSLTAAEAAHAIAAGVLDAAPATEVVRLPVADGGEGTLDALVHAGWTVDPVVVPGPTGDPVRARIAWRDRTGVVELADCCGRIRLPAGVPAPVTATTDGLGAAITAAVQRGAERVVVAVGGSASTDGGLGLLRALGVRVLDAAGAPVSAPLGLAAAALIDASRLLPAIAGTDVTFAVDVRAPLLGPTGAARLFAPQKGATPQQARDLEAALTRWAAVLHEHCGVDVAAVPGAGAAGGVVAGALGVLHARCPVKVVSGSGVLLDAVGLRGALRNATIVVVGEGALDRQSLLGKAAVEVARAARGNGRRVVAIAGRLDLDASLLREHGIDAVITLADLARPGEDPLRDAAVLARRAGARVVDLASGTGDGHAREEISG